MTNLIALGIATIFAMWLLAVLKLTGVLVGAWWLVLTPVCLLWAVEILGGLIWWFWLMLRAER